MKKIAGLDIILTSFIIFFLGIINLYSLTFKSNADIVKRQFLWALVAIFFAFFIYKIGLRRLIHYSLFLYLMGLILLILTYFFPSHSHIRAWLKIGPFNIQTAQLMKVILPLYMISMLYTRIIKSFFSLIPLIIIFLLPLLLIAKQPDLGTACLLLPGFITIIILNKVSWRVFFPWLLITVILLPLIYHNLEDYQKQRLLVFLNPDYDPLGAGYTLMQSKIAIGSGRLFGKGIFRGEQGQLKFLPESHTDFVFPVFAEEWGFLGASFLIAVYLFLFYRLYLIASTYRETAGRCLLFAYFFTFVSQVFINIGMCMGLLPIVGLPLPLFSYGGSDLVVTGWILGVFINAKKDL